LGLHRVEGFTIGFKNGAEDLIVQAPASAAHLAGFLLARKQEVIDLHREKLPALIDYYRRRDTISAAGGGEQRLDAA
jgi:hypothetical protein